MVPLFLSIKIRANFLKKILVAINLKKSTSLLFFFPIPPSNACVERVFSFIGDIWKEERNRLFPEMSKRNYRSKSTIT